ncbi:MAG: peptide-methionine (S)-S-oxide reductase MsrA [Leptolyngbyaceae cyanobacterium]
MVRGWIAAASLGLLSLFLLMGSAPAGAVAQAQATFAGGCFWCMKHPFDHLPGVLDTTSAYTVGTIETPSYYQVSNGNTGHVEAVQVTYDPDQVSYETLLETFWHNVDPLDEGGQFCDRGSQYQSVIFYHSTEQQDAAIAAKQTLEDAQQFDHPIVTPIVPSATFYPAEDYHQNYYETHPARYRIYRFGCGRDQRLTKLWGSGEGSTAAALNSPRRGVESPAQP